MCINTCKTAKCGDGKVQMGVEECDDANMVDNDACTNMCKNGFKRVFVTSTLQTGNMGGLAGADAICAARATAGGLPGTYKAWLSTDQVNGTPATRFTQSAVPYVKVNGVKVANNWADLIDGTLLSPIDVTELNGPAPQGTVGCPANNPTVWTATNANGTLSNALSTCTNWTSVANGSLWGRTTVMDTGWTAWCSGGTCSWTAPIYCFQQ